MIRPIVIDLLDESAVASTRAQLHGSTWTTGVETAGPVAAEVKHNLQIAEDDNTAALRRGTTNMLLQHDTFKSIVMPQVVGLMFSRYDAGHEYGLHVDSAMMGSGVRRDISFTIWLASPTAYEGGELIIESPFDEESFKGKAGQCVIYPATSLHRVTKVTQGTRLVIVGWARSLVRDAAKRELLFELNVAKSTVFAEHGKTATVDILSKCSANLLRMWMED